MDTLFSLTKDSPPGFQQIVPSKRQLLTGHIALLVNKKEDAFELIPRFCKRVQGVIVSIGEEFTHDNLSPNLWSITVPSNYLPFLEHYISCYLHILETTQQENEKNVSLINELTYSNKFYTQTQEGYNKAMERLQIMVQEANLENKKKKEAINQLNHEINERKKAQEEQLRLESLLHISQKMEAIGLMAGGVAHDLNNILSGVVGYPDLLLATLPDESNLRQPLEKIRGSGQRAAEVVSDLLTIARSSASSSEISNLNNILCQYLDSLEFKKLKADHPHVNFHLTLEDELDNICCSVPHVRKCLMNLIVNGVEAINDSGLLSISTYFQNFEKDKYLNNQVVQKGRYAVIRVKDNGQGITDEHLAHIFEPFYSRKKLGSSGSGLGLTVVWNTVLGHGGVVNVESSGEGKGTLFELFFPVTNKASSNQHEEIPIEQLQGSRESIMIVDDEEILLDIGRNMIQTLGYQATTMDSGEAAINFLAHNNVDLIILDMLMDPGMSGRQTYEAILEFRPDQRAIIASGFAENEDVNHVLKLGASSFLRKPYTMTSLGKAIKNALKSIRKPASSV